MSFNVYIDWAKNGAYGSGAYGAGVYGGVENTDIVTELVRPHTSVVTAEYGRDQSTALAPTVAGRGSLVLDNRDRRFSPRYGRYPSDGLFPDPALIPGFAENLKPARPVFISRTIGTTSYILFTGHTDDNPINPDTAAKTASISLVDWLADFRGQNISTPLYRGIRTGTAIGYVLDAVGWPVTLRDLDAGATYMPYWWEENTDGLTALEKIVRSEGPPALLTIGPSGEIVFKDRHHRATDTNSLTSQQTWWGLPGSQLTMQKPFDYDEAWRNIVNTGTEDVGVRTPGEQIAVWTSDSTITLTSGEQKTITASASDPFFGAVTPVAGTDYTLVSGSVAVTLTRTSGSAVGIVITSTGASVLTGLQLRATPCPVAYTLQITASDSESIDDYGRRSFPSDLPWCNQYDADAVISNAVALRAHPNPVVTTRFQITEDTKAALLLGRDLSDRITLYEEETALEGVEFFVESIGHDISGIRDHSIAFGLEAAPVLSDTGFRFDTSGHGFDDGSFDPGVVDPDLMLRFDGSTSGHRFDDAVFAQ